MVFEIKSLDGKTLFTAEGTSLRAALEAAVKAGANLGGADLGRANLRMADLGGADLGRANLRMADLGGANLRMADLGRANLGGADLRWANLRGADLRGANLRGADLRGANLGGADLRGADLDFASWPLWCGARGVRVDVRIARQLAAHFCAVVCDDPKYQAARAAVLAFARRSHVAKDMGL